MEKKAWAVTDIGVHTTSVGHCVLSAYPYHDRWAWLVVRPYNDSLLKKVDGWALNEDAAKQAALDAAAKLG